MRRFLSLARAFGSARAGGVALLFGLATPALVVGVSAAVEYASLAARRTKLQVAADSAALAGAQQLRLSNSTDTVIASIVKSTLTDLAPTPKDSRTDVATSVTGSRSTVQVAVTEIVPSIMGRLMTLPTMQLGVQSSARISGATKLCLLTLDASRNKALNLDKDSSVTAEGCAIYSNSSHRNGLTAERNARATATLICSAGGIANKGAVLSPNPTTDCPVVSDPLASTARPSQGSCTATSLKVTGSRTLWPGTYCKGITVSGTASLSLMPGIYVIDDGPLIVSNSATLTGQNVGLFFTGDAGGLRFDPDTTVSLTAPRSGQMAGLLFFEDRSVNLPVPLPTGPTGPLPILPIGSPPMREYRITSNNAPTLLGTIYLPAGRLVIDASRPVADRSAYTVIVSRQLDLNSGPNLYLNTNYTGTDIPVPNGVGPKSGNVALVK